MNENWACEAYGPDGIGVGALCFFAGDGERTCVSQAACHLAMTAERQRVFSRITDRAAQGDEMAKYLAETITSPDQILGGNG